MTLGPSLSRPADQDGLRREGNACQQKVRTVERVRVAADVGGLVRLEGADEAHLDLCARGFQAAERPRVRPQTGTKLDVVCTRIFQSIRSKVV